MHTWNILILVAEKENISEKRVWSYIEELGYKYYTLSTANANAIIFHFLIDVPSGLYRMIWQNHSVDSSSVTAAVVPHKIADSSNHLLCDYKIISAWISDCLNGENHTNGKYGKQLYAFIYCGGGFGFYTENEYKCPMSIRKWEKCFSQLIRKTGKKWDLIGFDCCLFSMLESVYQIRHLTKWFLACENYEPYQGFNSLAMVKAFENYDDPMIIGKIIISSFIRRVNLDPNADPTDMTLIKVNAKRLSNLITYLQKLPIRKVSLDLGPMGPNPSSSSRASSTARIDSADEDQNGYLDLYSFIINNENLTDKQKYEFHKLFKQIVRYYKRSDRLKMEKSVKTYGLSFCGATNLDPYSNGEDDDRNYSHYYNLDAVKKISWLGSGKF